VSGAVLRSIFDVDSWVISKLLEGIFPRCAMTTFSAHFKGEPLQANGPLVQYGNFR
jgi:hypothetical protein